MAFLSCFVTIFCFLLDVSSGFLIENRVGVLLHHHRHNHLIGEYHHHYHHQQQQQQRGTTSSLLATRDSSDNKIIDGKVIAGDIREEIREDIMQMHEAGKPTPGLAVILVGSRRDSQTYVNMKKKACEQVGIASFGFDYDESVTQEELVSQIQELNERDDVHGILVQLPLPSHINEQIILNAVDPSKDVDGLHPDNVAKLVLQGGTRINSNLQDEAASSSFSIACTPLGCIELLERSGIEIAGKHAVIIGRSNLVGLPVSFLLLHRDATVTIVHSKTTDIANEVSRGDIVIAAVGKANLVNANWLKDDAVVIDVGINSVDLKPEEIKQGSKKTYKLVGDVDSQSAFHKCSKITPVPGGVGPMTIAMLLRNTVNAYKRSS